MRHKEAKLGALPMTRFPLLPIHRFHLPIPLFFRINAVGTIPFQLSLRINPLFDVSRLLAIKCANGTRWRVAPYDGCECDGRGWLHKQQDGRRRGSFDALLPPILPGSAPRRQPGPRTKGLFCERRERARTLSILSECLAVWNIGRAGQRKANHHPSYISRPRSSRSPSPYPWRSCGFRDC